MRFFVYFSVLFAGGAVLMFIRNRMVHEVNQRLPDDEQFSLSIWALERSPGYNHFKIWRTHQQFYRASFLRLWYATALILTLCWMYFGWTALNALTW